MKRLYTNIYIEAIAVRPESQLLEGSITNAPMNVDTVDVVVFDDETGVTFDFDTNDIY